MPAGNAGGLFPPQLDAFGIGIADTLGPAAHSRAVYAGSLLGSFRQAADALLKLAGLEIDPKQVERCCHRVGSARAAQRDAEAEAFEKLPLTAKLAAPPGLPLIPAAVAVMVDGGRLQLREPAPGGGHWRQDNVAALATLDSQALAADPCPEPPPDLLDLANAARLAREVGHRSAPAESTPAARRTAAEQAKGTAAEQAKGTAAEQAKDTAAERTAPGVLLKTVVATRRNTAAFGKLAEAAAWRRGFMGARRRGFVADGQASNWTLWKKHFPNFVPILDLVHAQTYVYAAAMAGRSAAEGAATHRRWIAWVWGGEVAKVTAELAARAEELGPPPEEAAESDPRRATAEALRYLTTHAERMDYPRYRRLGLPISSAVMESTIKQINRRVKGTEKFWSERGAEAMLQLQADHLSGIESLAALPASRQTVLAF